MEMDVGRRRGRGWRVKTRPIDRHDYDETRLWRLKTRLRRDESYSLYISLSLMMDGGLGYNMAAAVDFLSTESNQSMPSSKG